MVLTAIGLWGLAGGCGADHREDNVNPPPVACSITNVSTGAQSSWLVGVDGPSSLRWDHQGPADQVRIDLLKGAAAVAVVEESTPNDGYYLWSPTVAGQPGGSDFGLRVSALGETGCAGELTGLTIHDVSGCALGWSMDLPDNLRAGNSFALAWTSAATTGTLDIELWQDDLGGPPEYVGTIAAETPDDGEYLWNPVDTFNFGSNFWFVLKLVDPRVPTCDALTDTFRIWDDENCSNMTYGFSAGSAFDEGQTLALTIEQTYGSGLVTLRLLIGALPIPGGLIAESVAVGTPFPWVVDDYGYAGADRTRFRIQVTDMVDPYCVGSSDVFTIR